MDDEWRVFLGEAAGHLDAAGSDLARLRQAPDEAARLRLFRRLHSLKGTATFFPLPRLAALAHAAEDGIESCPGPGGVAALLAALDRMRHLLDAAAREGAEPAGDDAALVAALAVREPAEDRELTGLLALLGDMAEARDRLGAALRRAGPAPPPLHRLVEAADVVACAPPEGDSEPVGGAFARLPRLAQGLEAALGRPFDLVLSGGDLPASPGVVAALADALPHLVRNAAVHGIEPAAARRAAGKPARGRVAVAARAGGARLLVTVEDDGAGLDRAAIDRAAARALSPAEAARLVFRPGLTTAGRVTPFAGRGIGLDAVRALVEAVGGTAGIASVPGRGTTCTLRLPRPPRPAAEPLPLARASRR